jgi:hypothetical protein
VTALVTPSASGKAVVEWNSNSNSNNQNNNKNAPPPPPLPPLSDYVSTWIPVASNSVASVSPKESLSTLFQNIDSILAIYGDQDAQGKASMKLLEQYVASAKLVELPGRHPCYLDSPQAFVDTIVEHLVSRQQNNENV